MFLKSLTIKGFKSFASSTTLDLEPGVAVIVGPNGSGKSNVVDAIAWVLGAQAPSAVRSQKMDDVIFAGTSKRAALGRAEVSLTIDNTSRLVPIEFEEVTITRTLFRTGDSEYQINGVSCRLLDIQELLSDTGVGRQQHVIISQGQIDAVLNARPEDRRSIIEEAAGVLKYRRRKEKSERRLKATEANLTRLQDLLREVRRQLKPLERQADAARRHGDLVDELRQLRTHVVGREVAELKDRLRRSAEERRNFDKITNGLKTRLRELDTEIITAEAHLSAAGASDSGEVLSRCEALRERLKGVDAVLAERVRSIDRERQTTVEGAVLSTLEADATQIRTELAEVETRRAELGADVSRVEAAEAEIEQQRKRFDDAWGDGVPSLGDETPQVRGELMARRQNSDQVAAERSGLVARAEELRTRIGTLEAEAEAHRHALRDGESKELGLIERLDAAHAALVDVEDRRKQARSNLEEAETDHQRWTARSEALRLAVDEARARSNADSISDIGGVLGPLLDLVEVDNGFESALAAALGDAADAVVVADAVAARDAITALQTAESSATILAAAATGGQRSAPPVGDPLRARVRASNPHTERLLDHLLGGVGVVDGANSGIDAALAHPDATFVTADGARFSPRGWQIGSERMAATGAALDEAVREAAAASELVATLTDQVAKLDAELSTAQKGRLELENELNASDDVTVATGEKIANIQRDLRDIGVEIDGIDGRVSELDDRSTRDGARIAELAARLAELEADEAAQLEQGQLMDAERSRLEERISAVAAQRADIEVRQNSLDEQTTFLTERLEDITQRIERHSGDGGAETAEARLAVANRLRELVNSRAGELDTWLGTLRAERQRQTDEVREVAQRLDTLRRERADKERELTELRERHSRAEIDDAEVTVRLEAAIDVLRRELDCEPVTAMETACPPLPEGQTARQRIAELERELRIMGPINPLALQEYEALSERFDFLTEQLDDVKASRRELFKVIRAIDEEIVNVFTSAYADVATNFEFLFSTLFPGGTGRLKLTDPNNALLTGIEVEARPSGKNVRKLSLLSGGERSLTALAFLFAVFRSRPSPFYVMDEVEAALDDINLHRFLDLVGEFRNDAQLLIVSHQKRTMEAADCLYGVSMKPGESSVVVSEKSGADMTKYVTDAPAAEYSEVTEPVS